MQNLFAVLTAPKITDSTGLDMWNAGSTQQLH